MTVHYQVQCSNRDNAVQGVGQALSAADDGAEKRT